jgi:hypothetical protein
VVDNITLEKRLMPYLIQLKLSDLETQQLIKELNYLSNLLIDEYIWNNHHGKHKADTSK